MKKFLLLFLFASSTIVTAKTYYVAPTGGRDLNPGTLTQPWATWQKAFNTVIAGDTVYFRGGVWTGTTTTIQLLNKVGTYSHPICFFNYPGEKPIFDCSSYTSTYNDMVGWEITNCTYIKFRGLTIKNCQQNVFGQWIAGLQVYAGGTLYFDQMTVTNSGGYGFLTYGYDTLYLTNCDSYNNYDLLAVDPGNRSDGFALSSGGQAGDYTYITGCRSWNNSDDGWEVSTSQEIYFANNWSFGNGRYEYGNGIGLKLGYSLINDPTKRRIFNNLIASNKGFGISFNFPTDPYHGPVGEFYNNTIYKGTIGFNDDFADGYDCTSGNGNTVHRNNIVFGPGMGYQAYLATCAYQPEVGPVYDTEDHNTWIKLMTSPFSETNPAFTVSNGDFVSVDTTGLSGPRGVDGSLPSTNFMKLVSTSDLINKGVDVGLPYTGSAPDLGAFEYGGTSTNPKLVTSINITGAGEATTITTNHGTLQLSASVLPIDASNKTVKWSITSGTDKASISSTGLVTALNNGITIARATAIDGSGVYGTLTITISNQVIPVTSISVTGTGGATTISTRNGTLQLVANVLPANATNKTVTWSITSGTDKASISSIGLVTALDNGTAVARATAIDGSGVYGTLTITISNQVIPVTSISVTGTGGATTISTRNGTLQLIANVLPANATNKVVIWSITSGTDKASISSTGLVAALDNGTAVARATANDGSGVYGTLTITVSNQIIPVSSITVTGSGGATLITLLGGTLQLNAAVLPSNAINKTVTWSITSGTDKASISITGLVTAIANGTAIARATANDGSGVFGTLTITISNQVIPVTNISVTGAGEATTISMDNGTLQLNANVLPSNATNKIVTWSITSGMDKALISSAGLVTAIYDGVVTVRANANDGSGIYGTLVITISNQTVPVSSVIVTSAGGISAITTENGTLQLSAEVLPSNAANKTVTWSITSGLSLASINSVTGLVTALDNGTVTTKATANDGSGIYGTFVITISYIKNSPPVIVVNYRSSGYSGFVNEINASGSYDANKDNLTFTWTAPGSITISSTTGSAIKYLGPIVSSSQTVEFTLSISDGKITQSRVIPIEILPYKPELEVAEIANIEASSFQVPYYPYNTIDGNIGTMWSAEGDDQWLIVELKHPFSVQHVKLAFQPGQKSESYFDILGSEDKISWEPILNKTASCAFSGDLQVFEFPPSKTGKEFNYIKLIGLGNSTDDWNYISELKIFGYRYKSSQSYENLPVKIYPNPAREFVTIRIDESSFKPDFVQIISKSGAVVIRNEVNPDIRELTIPINLKNGIYIIQLGSGNLTLFTQKLVVIR